MKQMYVIRFEETTRSGRVLGLINMQKKYNITRRTCLKRELMNWLIDTCFALYVTGAHEVSGISENKRKAEYNYKKRKKLVKLQCGAGKVKKKKKALVKIKETKVQLWKKKYLRE